MVQDPLGTVYNKRDNTGEAVVFPESKESVADYYLKQDAIARKRADKILDLSEGKASTMMSKFWDKDKPYAAKLRDEYLTTVGQVYKQDPLLKSEQSRIAIWKAEDKVRDASHLSEVQEKYYIEKVRDITKYPDLYPDRDAALKALNNSWADKYSPERSFLPEDPSTMRSPTTDVFKYIKTLSVPWKQTSKPVDVGGGVIKQVDQKEFDPVKSEAEAHLFLSDVNNKFARRLLSMGNDYVESVYPNMDDKDKSMMATEWATQHYVQIQQHNLGEWNKEVLKNAPKGDTAGAANVRREGDTIYAGNNYWKYRTDQLGREIFTFGKYQKSGEAQPNKDLDFVDNDGKTVVRGKPGPIVNDPKKGWTLTADVPVYKNLPDKNVVDHYERKEVPYNENNIDQIAGEYGLTPMQVKAKLGLSTSTQPSAAPDKVVVGKGKQKDSEIKQMRDDLIKGKKSIGDRMLEAQKLRKRKSK